MLRYSVSAFHFWDSMTKVGFFECVFSTEGVEHKTMRWSHVSDVSFGVPYIKLNC